MTRHRCDPGPQSKRPSTWSRYVLGPGVGVTWNLEPEWSDTWNRSDLGPGIRVT